MNKELENCTFKPNVNHNYPLKENEDGSQMGRIEYLYKMGLQIFLNRKDKTKDDIDKEKNEKECTFTPNIDS